MIETTIAPSFFSIDGAIILIDYILFVFSNRLSLFVDYENAPIDSVPCGKKIMQARTHAMNTTMKKIVKRSRFFSATPVPMDEE